MRNKGILNDSFEEWPNEGLKHREEELKDGLKRFGVAYNTIWRLENGRTGAQPRTIRKLAAALGVDPEELVKVEGGSA